MIQFFDIKTGETYNGDYPYIHWAEPFSIGVIRYKELFFLADNETVKVGINKPEDWNFALYSSTPVKISHLETNKEGQLVEIAEDPNVEYDLNNFTDIRAHAVGSATLTGQRLGDKYAFQLLIICKSDVEGEFIEDFTIDGQTFRIGAEFWGENESLRVNLANQGTELPELIGRAIYDADLYEDNPDWVLLNRKFRELLIQHMDVMDNKGSYESLFNALKWFEYQDLVELREVWKFQTPDGTKYYDRPVDTFITEEAKTRMFNSAKTTYFALRQLKRTISGTEDKEIEVPVQKINITVTKRWNDENDKDGIRPDSIDIDLLRNGTVFATATLTSAAGWMYQFNDLDETDGDGIRYIYAISEPNVPEGYKSDVSGFTIINTHAVKPDPKKYTVTVIPGANSTADKDAFTVFEGESASATFTADEGYRFEGNEKSVTKVVDNVTSDITIYGPDAKRFFNPIDPDTDRTPYICWYPVHGDQTVIGLTEQTVNEFYYNGLSGAQLEPYKDFIVFSADAAGKFYKQIYITADDESDKIEIWDSIKNNTYQKDLVWYCEGPISSESKTGEVRRMIFEDSFDPSRCNDDFLPSNTYMRAVLCGFGIAIPPSGKENEFGSLGTIGEYKIWAEWKGQKSNIITIVVDPDRGDRLKAKWPDLVKYMEDHPVIQPIIKTGIKKTASVAPDRAVSKVQTVTYEDLITYEHDPLEGEVKNLACKWSEEEMRLKMVLLGNFFETYFMPVHTDLIRSVIEDVHGYITNIQTGTLEDIHEECFTEANDFEFDWSGDTPDNPNDPDNNSYYLKEIHAHAGTSDEQYRFENAQELMSKSTYELEYVPIIGCTPFDPNESPEKAGTADDEQLFNLMRGQLYNGVGAIVTGHFKFGEMDGDEWKGDGILSGECESNQWGDFVKTSFVADGSKSEFDINFLFPAPGDFTFIFRFKGKSGKVYSKIATITITDNLVVDLEFYALVANTDRNLLTPNPFVSEPDPKYMFMRTKERNYTLEGSEMTLTNGSKIPATNLWLNEDWGQYSQMIPIRSSKDSTSDRYAPYMTHVRKVFFANPGAEARCAAYMGEDFDEKYWYEKVVNEHGDIQLRYCSKFRGQPLPVEPRTAGRTVVDSDVFFPELHTLMRCSGDVYHGIPIICRPVLRFANTNKKVNYSDLIAAKDFSWEFFSWGLQRNINELKTSSDDALLAWNYAVDIPCGYYTITFRYKFGNKEVSIPKQTPFRLVNEYKPLDNA